MFKSKSIFHRVFINNLTLMLIPFFILTFLVDYLICVRHIRDENQKSQIELHEYVTNAKLALENSVKLSENVINYPYLTDNLNKNFTDYYDVVTFLTNAQMYLDNVTAGLPDDTIRIHCSNGDILQEHYFVRLEDDAFYNGIKQKFIENETNILWDNTLKSNADGQFYLSFYRYIFNDVDAVLECKAYFPDPPSTIYIAETEKIIPSASDTIIANINETYSAILKTDNSIVIKKCFLTVLYTFCILVFLIAFLIFITYKTTSRVTADVTEFLQKLTPENLLTEFSEERDDVSELVVMKKALNTLIEKVNKISAEHYAAELKRKDTELQKRDLELTVLREQIDPHTLYNSLSVIKFSAVKRGDNELYDLVDNMVKYYRSILSKKNTFIPLSEEIDMIKKYITINELSQDTKYNFTVDMDSKLKNIPTLHLLLQPFVENAIIHGLSGREEECAIHLSCRMENGCVVICITDNGRGIKPEILRKLQSIETFSGGIGIKNAYLRLKLAYGDESGVHYENMPAGGTRVTISFPSNPKS